MASKITKNIQRYELRRTMGIKGIVGIILVGMTVCGLSIRQANAVETHPAKEPKSVKVDLQQGDFDTTDVQLPTGWEVQSVQTTPTGGLVVWSKALFAQETASCRTWTSLVYVVESTGNKLFILHGKDASCATRKTVTTTVIRQ
jgi:hypothetical protein